MHVTAMPSQHVHDHVPAEGREGDSSDDEGEGRRFKKRRGGKKKKGRRCFLLQHSCIRPRGWLWQWLQSQLAL